MRSHSVPPQAATHGFMGASPDGLGAILTGPNGQRIDQTPTTHYWRPPGPVAGEIAFLEPQDTSGQAAVQSAGFTALVLAMTTGVGLAWGKGWGAVGGFLAGATAINAYRAQKWLNDPDPGRRHEAVTGATLAVAESVLTGYSLWKASQGRRR